MDQNNHSKSLPFQRSSTPKLTNEKANQSIHSSIWLINPSESGRKFHLCYSSNFTYNMHNCVLEHSAYIELLQCPSMLHRIH